MSQEERKPTPAAQKLPRRDVWRLDRQVSLAIVFAVIVETAGAFMWAGAVSARVGQMEVQLSERTDELRRLALLEAHVEAMRAQLDRIEGRLNMPLPTPAPALGATP